MLGAAAEEGGPHFQVKYDVSKAHRRLPVQRCDWGRQACQLRGSAAECLARALDQAEEVKRKRPRRKTTSRASAGTERKIRKEYFTAEELKETIYLNTVGSFGVGSAGHWLGRGGGALIRLTQYLLGRAHALWSLLYADDGELIGRTS